MVKRELLLLVATCLLLISCGGPQTTVSDGKGNSVTTTEDGSKITATDDKGDTTTIEAKDGDVTATKEDGSKVSIETNDGTTTYTDTKAGTTAQVGAVISEEELGVSFYPGSKEDKEASMKGSSPEGNTYLCVRTTEDSLEQIAEFYEKELQKPTVTKSPEFANISGKSADGTEVIINALKSPDSKAIRITITLSRK